MIPFSTLTERLDMSLRMVVPYALMALFFMLNVVALPYPFNGAGQIPFIMIMVYYWAIYRPTLIPPYMIFLCGVLFDILTGGPLGLSVLIFLATYWVITDQRNVLMAQSFLMIWLGFGVVYAAALSLQWIGFGMLQQGWASPLVNVVPWMLGFLSFPFMGSLLHMSHKILPAPDIPLIGASKRDGFSMTD